MRRLLILGATENQLPLIKAARESGIYVIVCDWTTTNPGISLANKHYQVSTMDLEAVLKVATTEKIDGVLTNSEPALMNATIVAEKLGLRGNSVQSIDTLTSKIGFRDLQDKIGLFAPRHYFCDSLDKLLESAHRFNGAFVVKPVRSSGSRGTTMCSSFKQDIIEAAYKECTEFSRDGFCSVEEYVPMPSLQVIDGDVFLNNGEILWDGLFLSVRSPIAPFVPATQVFPLLLPEEKIVRVKNDITKALMASGVKHGEYNIEAFFTNKGDFFIIEINARQGGNHIPSNIFEVSGVDFNKMLVTTAVGDDTYWYDIARTSRQYKNMTFHPVYAHDSGILKDIVISDQIATYLLKMENVKKKGDAVDKCQNATGIVAFSSFLFPNALEQKKYSLDMEEYIYPLL